MKTFDMPSEEPIRSIAASDETSGARKIHTVYVEADKIEDLKAAYPNYFGDVQVFNSNLASVVDGKPTKEFTMPPRRTVPRPPREPADFTWLRPGGHRRWVEPLKPRKPKGSKKR